jgi:hypothetical protein
MRLIVIIVLFNLLLLGCSGVNPIATEIPAKMPSSLTTDNNWSWGAWEFSVSSDHTKIEAVPIRDAQYHYCVTKFVEEYPCPDCLKIGKPHIEPDGSVKLSVTLRHPFPGQPQYTGFDVRGMVYFPPTRSYKTELTYTSPSGTPDPFGFPAAPHFMPLTFSRAEDGGGEVLNADGYSCYMIPGVTYHKKWLIFSYYPGKYGIEPTPQLTTVNPYILFASENNDRRMFFVTDEITREYHLKLPDGAFTFGYAVDASWCPPTKLPVTDPSTDFPLHANAEDPWSIEFEQLLPIKEENVGKPIFKVKIGHRGTDYYWGAEIFSWTLSTYDFTPHPAFGFPVFDQFDPFTNESYCALSESWWYLFAVAHGKLYPGHHLGVLVVRAGEGLEHTELRFVYGVRFVDIYIEE